MILNLFKGTALLALLLHSLLFLPIQLYARWEPQSGIELEPERESDLELTTQKNLFEPVDTVGLLDPIDPFIVQNRFVTPDINQIDITTTELQINFFEDADFSVEQTGIQSNRSGSFTWFGKVVDDEESIVILVVKDDIVVGNVESNGEFYQVRYAGDDVHAVYEIDHSKFPLGAEPLLPDGIQTPVDPNGFDPVNGDDGSRLDVMVLYTLAAKFAAGGTTAMEALIDLAVAETNTAYNSSGVYHRLNLVHQAEVAYDESTASASREHLSRLHSPNDGHMDSIHDLRDTHKADVVSLLLSTASFCGLAYVMPNLSPDFESSAFSVVQIGCATGNYSFGHEIGHNLGLLHDRDSSSNIPAYPYGYGYQEPNSSFRTIMAYNCPENCTRIQQFSNPDVNYNGSSTGIDHDTNPGNSADSVRAMNNARVVAANWRVSDIKYRIYLPLIRQ